MRSRNRNARPLRRVFHLDHIKFDVIGRTENLALYLLRLRQHGVTLTEAHGNSVAVHIKALYDAGHQIMFFFKIIVINDLALFLTDFL